MKATKVYSTIDDLLWPNRYMLTFLGFWPMESNVTPAQRLFAYLRIIISIFIMSTLFVPEVLMIIVSWGNISILTEVGCITITAGQLIFKFLYMIARQRKFCCMYQSTKELWMITENMEGRESYEKLAIQAKRLTIVFFVTATSNIFTITTASVIIWVKNYLQANDTFYTRQLPFNVWYGIDTQATPNFEIFFSFQWLAMVYGATGVVGFDSTMMTLILHICGQFSLLRARFCAIGDRIRDNAYSKVHCQRGNVGLGLEIERCIEHHLRAIRIAKEMNSLLSPVIFVQLMTSGVEICLCGYALLNGVEGSNNSEMIKFTIYLMSMFLQLTIWCWPGELLIQESGDIGDVVCYELPWYKLTISQQRDLGFVMFRTHKECQVTAFGFQVMSLRKLTEVFNTAASYFALLRSINEKQMH